MLLNRFEFMLMNNRARAMIQRHVEARRLVRMGGRMGRGAALEIGCGRGIGLEIILDVFGAETVHGFDLDPRMVSLASNRLAGCKTKCNLRIDQVAIVPEPVTLVMLGVGLLTMASLRPIRRARATDVDSTPGAQRLGGAEFLGGPALDVWPLSRR